MKLYHGSNVEVKNPQILESDRKLDFGTGFYVTTSIEQAEKWADLTAKRRGVGKPVANDRTMPVISLYFSGIYSEEETVKRLLPQKLKDQVVFKTQKALSLLTFMEAIVK